VLRHVTGENLGIAAIEILPVETNSQNEPASPSRAVSSTAVAR
jgi:hypothetical protein